MTTLEPLEPPGQKPPPDPSAARHPGLGAWIVAFIALLVASLALASGTILGRGGTSPGPTDMEEAVQKFIAENPQFVIDTLNRHASDQAEAERRQAIGLLRGNDGWTVMGNPSGDVTIYEFSDYNCGYCKRVFADLTRLLEDDGNVRLVVKEFPILSEGSVIAARYALAAARMGRFEEFHRAAMAWPGRVDQDAVDRITADLGLDWATFEAWLADAGIDSVIDENRRIARELEVSGTPAFVVGNAIAPGAISLADFKKLVAQARGEAGRR